MFAFDLFGRGAAAEREAAERQEATKTPTAAATPKHEIDKGIEEVRARHARELVESDRQRREDDPRDVVESQVAAKKARSYADVARIRRELQVRKDSHAGKIPVKPSLQRAFAEAAHRKIAQGFQGTADSVLRPQGKTSNREIRELGKAMPPGTEQYVLGGRIMPPVNPDPREHVVYVRSPP